MEEKMAVIYLLMAIYFLGYITGRILSAKGYRKKIEKYIQNGYLPFDCKIYKVTELKDSI